MIHTYVRRIFTFIMLSVPSITSFIYVLDIEGLFAFIPCAYVHYEREIHIGAAGESRNMRQI